MKTCSPPVFYYHSVAPQPFEGWLLKHLTLKLRVFEGQLAYLRRRGFRTLFLDEWLDFRQGRKSATGKELCLTFDDGYLDNWVYAFPLVKKYGMRFTLFVSPECMAPGSAVRPTLADVWEGRCKEDDLESLGYLTWPELRLMQESGVVDVQSHTMTHAKYPVLQQVKIFYYGGGSGRHSILNGQPDLRWRYMHDPDFEKRLPLGTPIFHEKSAVVAKRHFPNPTFTEETLAVAANYDLTDAGQRPDFEREARKIYARHLESGSLVGAVEQEEDFQKRLSHEIVESKKIIEDRLQKPVRFLCWPHGENTTTAHELAKNVGYLATTAGKMKSAQEDPDRIPRLGADLAQVDWLGRLKFHYKISAHYQKQPWHAIWQANEMRHRVRKKKVL